MFRQPQQCHRGFISGFDQSRADFVAHGMGGAVAPETHHALDLERADTFLAGQHQVDDPKPLSERLIRILEDRSGNVREAIGRLRERICRHCQRNALPVN